MPGNVVFRAVGAQKKSVQVAEQILEAIQRGVYRVGDKLPPERVIEQETGVSKTSVREALSALHLAGIVERIAGSGTFVRSCPQGWGALALLEESESVEDALEARRVVERGVLELAIEQAEEAQLGAVQRVSEEMRSLLGAKDYERFFDLNEEFHLAVAESTGNPLIVKVVRLLLQVTRQRLWKQMITDYFLRDERHFRRAIEDHRRIGAALAKRDKERVVRAMEEHFISAKRILQEGS
ncbi:MAG: FadR family transcriptional regulator [Candidatus Acetothermia bacterium]|jgi:GntR family transcriptional repressor for pyruvate dehydrogenase complex|nr:FadR family transcriptional regulator [Candidatus Acetothermia bacterium]MDH7504825.1 FadR/GntR family transcriptional regulator [Candidatus Acetothermia bacterium]